MPIRKSAPHDGLGYGMRKTGARSLIDGRRLAELMIDFDLGVNAVATYQMKRVDSDYFDEGGAV